MIINEEINRFINTRPKSGHYMIYAKDVINEKYCKGIYFIHEDEALKPRFKKITKPKQVNIILVNTLYINSEDVI